MKKKIRILLKLSWSFDGGEYTGNINRKKKLGVLQDDRCPLCDKCYRRD